MFGFLNNCHQFLCGKKWSFPIVFYRYPGDRTFCLEDLWWNDGKACKPGISKKMTVQTVTSFVVCKIFQAPSLLSNSSHCSGFQSCHDCETAGLQGYHLIRKRAITCGKPKRHTSHCSFWDLAIFLIFLFSWIVYLFTVEFWALFLCSKYYYCILLYYIDVWLANIVSTFRLSF